MNAACDLEKPAAPEVQAQPDFSIIRIDLDT